MLQYIAEGFLDDGDELRGNLRADGGGAFGYLYVPLHFDTTLFEHTLHAVPQPRQTISEKFPRTIHGVHDQAQVQHALFENGEHIMVQRGP